MNVLISLQMMNCAVKLHVRLLGSTVAMAFALVAKEFHVQIIARCHSVTLISANVGQVRVYAIIESLPLTA